MEMVSIENNLYDDYFVVSAENINPTLFFVLFHR